MNNGDAFDDLDTCEAGIDIWRRAVLGDPLEHVFNRATIFDPLTVAGDGCERMKGGAHEIAVPCASARNVTVHSAGDRVMFDEVAVDARFGRGVTLGFVA